MASGGCSPALGHDPGGLQRRTASEPYAGAHADPGADGNSPHWRYPSYAGAHPNAYRCARADANPDRPCGAQPNACGCTRADAYPNASAHSHAHADAHADPDAYFRTHADSHAPAAEPGGLHH